MMDKHTDFFKYIDNFAKIAHVVSVPVKNPEMESPLVTIAIPTYKRADLLKEAIDSALNQDCDDTYEVLVIDNNPERDDETERLMHSYSGYANISYYKNAENVGMFGNWNRMLTLAQGKWVVMLHDDDMLKPFFLKTIVPLLNDDCGVIACRYHKLNEGVLSKGKRWKKQVEKMAFIDFAWGDCIGAPVGVVMHKEKAISIGGFNEVFYPASDYHFFANMTLKHSTLMVNDYLSIYRMECNASIKIETLNGFMRMNYMFSRAIWQKCNFPQWLWHSVELCRIRKQIKSLRRNWNKGYDCTEIPYSKNLFLYWCSYYIMYTLVYKNYVRISKWLKRNYYV